MPLTALCSPMKTTERIIDAHVRYGFQAVWRGGESGSKRKMAHPIGFGPVTEWRLSAKSGHPRSDKINHLPTENFRDGSIKAIKIIGFNLHYKSPLVNIVAFLSRGVVYGRRTQNRN